MKAEAKAIRKVLKEAGLYRQGSAGRGGSLGATRVWDYGDHVTIVPAAGLHHDGIKTLSEQMFSALKTAGFNVHRSTSGRGTSGEDDLRVNLHAAHLA